MRGDSFSEKQTRDNAVSRASVGAPRRMSAKPTRELKSSFVTLRQRQKPCKNAGGRVWIWRVRDNGTFHVVEVPCFLGQSPRARELKSSFFTLRRHTKNPAFYAGFSGVGGE